MGDIWNETANLLTLVEWILLFAMSAFLVILGVALHRKKVTGGKQEELRQDRLQTPQEDPAGTFRLDAADAEGSNTVQGIQKNAELAVVMIGVVGMVWSGARLMRFFSVLTKDAEDLVYTLVLIPVCIGLMLWQLSAARMGSREKQNILYGTVIRHQKQSGYYRPVVAYQEGGQEKYHVIEMNFSKRKVPAIGESVELLYSYEWKKVTTKQEQGKHRRYALLAGLCAVLMMVYFLMKLAGLMG